MAATLPAISLQDRIAAAEGRPSGFDYLRILLAIIVIVDHAPTLTLGAEIDPWSSVFGPPLRLVVPMFFALSGFLVAGSFERSKTLVKFFGLRVIRIFPALAVETIVSAIIIGPMLTTLALGAYFTDPLFFRYFINILGEPQYLLPGVFESNPTAYVNGQLWTIPFELACYVSVAVVALLGGQRRRVVVPLVTVATLLIYLLARGVYWHSFPALNRALPGPMLVSSFLAGVSFYVYRDRVSASHLVGTASGLVSVVLMALPGFWQFLAPITTAYFTCYLGSLNPRRIAMLKTADLSYGLYLYGSVNLQVFVAMFPDLRMWPVTAAYGVSVGLVIAGISWAWVEKPALKLRKQVDAIEQYYLRRRQSRVPVPPRATPPEST